MEFTVGQRATIMRTVSADDVAAFARLSGDYNPLHTDEEFARRSRFGGRIAHGLFTASLLSTVLGMHLPGPGGIYLSQTLRFLKPVRIGDVLTAAAEVTAFDRERRRLTLRTTCTNQRAEVVLEGEAVTLVDAVAGPAGAG